MKTKIFLLLIISLFNTYSVTRYVSKEGSATPPYLSWTTAARTIKQCVQVCQYWDTILVGKGTFKEDTLYLRDNLTLLGSGMDSTIIDIRQGTVVYFDNNTIKYFSFLAGDERFKGIWAALSSNKLSQNLIFEGNKVINGQRGLYLTQKGGTTLIVKNNFFSFSERGIFVSSESSSTKTFIEDNVFNCEVGINISFGGKHLIENNIFNLMKVSSGVAGGPAYYGGEIGDTSFIKNNIILSEHSSSEGLEMVGEYAEIENNTFIGKYYLKCIWIGRNALIRNNLLLSLEKNGSAGFKYTYGIQGNPIINYNLVHNFSVPAYGFTLNNTNLLSDPMVVNQDTFTTFDAHLQKYSPAIDAGDPTILDKDGTRSDIGYFGGPGGESYTYQDLAPRKPRALYGKIDTTKIRLAWKGGTERDFKNFIIYKDTTINFTPDSSKIVSVQRDTVYIDTFNPSLEKHYYYKITAVDSQDNVSLPSQEISFILLGIKDEEGELSNGLDYELYNNYPNPFNPSTSISFRMKKSGFVKLQVYNIAGELVSTIKNEHMEAGYHEVEYSPKSIDYNDIASGIYILRLDIRGENNVPVYNDSKKMIYMK
ncbi:MAG TPA: right-handed parallel beta-helix repeat-containing protein [Ignavibacteriaceae bacterium]|nr:right-handed parallel beta-helix repeat-containing protein [Ignavibacteriaceae bacterium]